MQALTIKGHSGFHISCWQTVGYGREGEDIRQRMLWSSAQEQELFAYLLHHRGQTVGTAAIAELLWPDSQQDKTGEIGMLLNQMRRTLDRHELHENVVNFAELDAGYMLTLGDASVDAVEWEEWINRLGEPTIDTVTQHERALAAYTGDYLAAYAYIWAVPERARLRELWLARAAELSDFYMRHGEARSALRLNHRIQQLHPYVDDSYFTLMKLYDERGDRLAADRQYELLCSRWLEHFGRGPDVRITSWYAQRGDVS